MQHRDGYGNEHDRNEKRGTEVSQEERDWSYEVAEQYYGELTLEHDDEEVEDDEVEQEEAGNLYKSENNSEEFEDEGRADHQEDHQAEFDAEDTAESTYTDVHFNDLKKARGRIKGEEVVATPDPRIAYAAVRAAAGPPKPKACQSAGRGDGRLRRPVNLGWRCPPSRLRKSDPLKSHPGATFSRWSAGKPEGSPVWTSPATFYPGWSGGRPQAPVPRETGVPGAREKSRRPEVLPPSASTQQRLFQ